MSTFHEDQARPELKDELIERIQMLSAYVNREGFILDRLGISEKAFELLKDQLIPQKDDELVLMTAHGYVRISVY